MCPHAPKVYTNEVPQKFSPMQQKFPLMQQQFSSVQHKFSPVQMECQKFSSVQMECQVCGDRASKVIAAMCAKVWRTVYLEAVQKWLSVLQAEKVCQCWHADTR